MKIKKIFSLISILGMTSFIFTNLSYAASSATVAATVTIQNISVSVSDGDVSYGTLATSTSRSTIASEENEMQTATNNGNITENLNIKGQNTAAWTLSATAGADQYVHKFCNDTDNDCTTPPTNYTALTTNYQTLDTSVTTSGTADVQLQITTPSSSSSFTQQSVDVIVQAVAP